MKTASLPWKGQIKMLEWQTMYNHQENFKAVKNYILNGGKKPAPNNVSSLLYISASINQKDSFLYNPDRYSAEDLARYENEIIGERKPMSPERLSEIREKIKEEDLEAEKEYTALIDKKSPDFEALKLQLL